MHKIEPLWLKAMFFALSGAAGYPRGQALLSDLNNCNPGKADAAIYQKVVERILEHLFCPALGPPRSEHSDSSRHNRRDIIMANYAEGGFWRFLRERYCADYVVVDAKNHSGMIAKAHALQVSNYLKEEGVGLFGIIVCRKGADKACVYTIRERWFLEGKLILVLTDEDLKAMLEAKDAGEPAENVVRQRLEEFRLAV
ncbi:hypothetical protein [Vulgatibacter incomptus]|uniref:hypothetical protein n=1 Tax=Vulgatibacter incomptus TaxID=1391653 RepID=UPI00147060EF|nr:hypothetical protein [Vulgatibacter incomptus]